MALSFQELGYAWTTREGSPQVGSVEPSDPTFTEALCKAYPKLSRYTKHELASWIVARLNFLTAGTLSDEGEVFSHDSNEVGYRIKITDQSNEIAAFGAIMIHADRTYFAVLNIHTNDFQSLVVELLTEFPDDVTKCEIRVQEPETRRFRSYGWNGNSFLA